MASTNKPAQQIRIVLADDHPIFRDGLIRLLETKPELRVIGAAADGDEALRLVKDLDPDVLLLDLAMPRMTGLVALRELGGQARARIIMLTAAIDGAEIVTALQLGARGVVLKDSASEMLLKAIQAVMAGQYFVGRKAVQNLAITLRELSASAAPPTRKQFGLTPRELEIIGGILGGLSNSDIATRFKISEKTVKHHLTNIFDKLGVSNRLELALFALHHNLNVAVTPAPATSPNPP